MIKSQNFSFALLAKFTKLPVANRALVNKVWPSQPAWTFSLIIIKMGRQADKILSLRHTLERVIKTGQICRTLPGFLLNPLILYLVPLFPLPSGVLTKAGQSWTQVGQRMTRDHYRYLAFQYHVKAERGSTGKTGWGLRCPSRDRFIVDVLFYNGGLHFITVIGLKNQRKLSGRNIGIHRWRT